MTVFFLSQHTLRKGFVHRAIARRRAYLLVPLPLQSFVSGRGVGCILREVDADLCGISAAKLLTVGSG